MPGESVTNLPNVIATRAAINSNWGRASYLIGAIQVLAITNAVMLPSHMGVSIAGYICTYIEVLNIHTKIDKISCSRNLYMYTDSDGYSCNTSVLLQHSGCHVNAAYKGATMIIYSVTVTPKGVKN